MPAFDKRRGRMLRLTLAPLTLAFALCACGEPIRINRAALPCSKLVPEQLTADTPGADLPTENTVGAWMAFGDAQTGQLDKANLMKGSSLAIIRQCEARDAAIDAQLTKHKKVVGIF